MRIYRKPKNCFAPDYDVFGLGCGCDVTDEIGGCRYDEHPGCGCDDFDCACDDGGNTCNDIGCGCDD